MIRIVCSLIVILSFSSASWSQQFEAEIDGNGNIQLVPVEQAKTDNNQELAGSEKGEFSPMPKMPTGSMDGTTQNGFLVFDAQGTFQGFVPDQNQLANFPIGTGYQIRSVPVAANMASFDVTEYRQIAEKAAKELLAGARNTACALDPLPATISPEVEVSFQLFADGRFAISATWETGTLCPSD